MAWKKDEECLAPWQEEDYYRIATITDILTDAKGLQYAVVLFESFGDVIDIKKCTQTVDLTVLLNVPKIRLSELKDDVPRTLKWKKDDLCLVHFPAEGYFKLAIICGRETDAEGKELADVQFITDGRRCEKPIHNYVSVSNLRTVSTKKISPKKKGLGKKVAFGLAGAIGMAILTPIAIPVAVGALGFGTAGIVAGSPAAAIMASYGGAVASGSACAIMQSIGAAGLSAAGTLLGGAAGAAAGGAAGVVAGEIADRLNEDKKDDKKE